MQLYSVKILKNNIPFWNYVSGEHDCLIFFYDSSKWSRLKDKDYLRTIKTDRKEWRENLKQYLNKKFWEELIRLLSLHKPFIWSTWI
jgi:hypothetical protein